MLLTGADERGREQIVLAAQRYGRGKTIVLTAAGHLALAHAREDGREGSDVP